MPSKAAAGGSVAAGGGASVGGAAGYSVTTGASVAVAAPPHAARTMLARTNRDSKANSLRFTFLLLRELWIEFRFVQGLGEIGNT